MLDAPAVLVVDDDLSTQGLFAAIIKHIGLRPITTGDGGDALKIIAVEKPSALILDLLMPGIDGFQVLRHFKLTAPEMLRRTIVVTAASGQRVEQCAEIDDV